ncbi:MAG TPA: hypothetical protein VJ022_14610 [Anaerolineales bacterium]|nr:hypothetical protein [Anaerolineales bacterium]
MKVSVSARGFTNVILVLNMKRFVHEEDQAQFERIRGKEEFAHTLREVWPQRFASQEKFITIEEEKRHHGRPDTMSTEQVGFATGVFRSLFLEKYSFPAYALDKEKAEFSDELLTNFQFKTLFWKIWNKWNIYVRPTNTGFFVIRLTSRYPDKSRPFIKLAQDILRLQESLDIRSAQNWLHDAREKYADDPETLSVKERSVSAFLEWLGVDENYTGDVLYYPVQWRLAMEVCSRFVEAIGSEIFVNGREPIRLEVPKPSISIPLHDSYVVHHFIEISADEEFVRRSRPNEESKNSQITIGLNDVRESPEIRQALVNLSEGAILKTGLLKNRMETTDENNTFFPKHQWGIVDDVLKRNQATWIDELCLVNSKTAIILPSTKWLEHELFVSSVPGSTLRVEYRRYWDAIERMIEFLIEIRVMAQLIESASYDILVETAERIHQTQSKLFGGDIIMDEKLPELVARAASLRHQAALCQSLSHPQLWSRADFAISKADYLLEQLGVPRILEHVERNINSIVEFVNHIDELYLADLSEKSNDTSTVLSLVLAAASFTLTLLMLPSFWADIWVILPQAGTPQTWQIIIGSIGTFFAVVLLGLALWLIIMAWKQRRKLWSTLQKIYGTKVV